MGVRSKIIERAKDVGCISRDVDGTEKLEDLDLDSLDQFELIIWAEDEFVVTIDDEAAETFVTLNDVIEFVEKAAA